MLRFPESFLDNETVILVADTVKNANFGTILYIFLGNETVIPDHETVINTNQQSCALTAIAYSELTTTGLRVVLQKKLF